MNIEICYPLVIEMDCSFWNFLLPRGFEHVQSIGIVVVKTVPWTRFYAHQKCLHYYPQKIILMKRQEIQMCQSYGSVYSINNYSLKRSFFVSDPLDIFPFNINSHLGKNWIFFIQKRFLNALFWTANWTSVFINYDNITDYYQCTA